MRETVGQFAARVKERTGVEMGTMPVRRIRSGSMSHIFAKCGNIFVCATGYPSHVDEETGTEYFTTFEVVIIG